MPKIAKAQGRSVEEWVGKTPDSVPPPHVRLRIFDRYNGCCYLSGRKIQPSDKWDLDHIKRLEDGGLNIESNLAPALRDKHIEKTAEETARGKKADRSRKAHLGIRIVPSRPMQSPPPTRTEKTAKRVRREPVQGLSGLARQYVKE
jgi:5-methylcytosine-specific restriction enzyme A